MKSNSKIFILSIMIMLLSIRPLHAEKIYQAGPELPLEMKLILNFFQNEPKVFSGIFPIIYGIDTYARVLKKEDVFVVGKIEVYKTLLKNNGPAIKTPIDGNSIATLQLAMKKTDNTFLAWFLDTLLKDAQDLMANPLYKEFLLQKNNNIRLEKVEYRRLEKKGELLQFWISKISPTADNFPENISLALRPKLLESLASIQRSFYLMASQAALEPLPQAITTDKELKFFTVKEFTGKPSPQKSETAKGSDSKSVEEILAPITDSKGLDLPRPSQENWLQDENAPASLQNLPKPANDADWLQDF